MVRKLAIMQHGLTTTGAHMPLRLTWQCYLPPGRGDIPTFAPAESSTAFSDHRGGSIAGLNEQPVPSTNYSMLAVMVTVPTVMQN